MPRDLLAALEVPIDAVLTLDFETFYGDDYTLSKLTTESYVRDPRFECIGVGVKIGTNSAVWMDEAGFRKWAATVPWARVAVLCHHTHFDGLILAHHFGINPGFLLDTLSMARALHGTEVGNSLANLSRYYEAGEKGREVLDAKGKRLSDFTPEEYAAYGRYCCNDCDLTWDIFNKMIAAGFPEIELHLIDLIVRMFTEPTFVLDRPLLETFLVDERARKAELLARVVKDKSVLVSNEKFAALLKTFGEIPPTKISPTTKLETWAFAKTDTGMQILLEHPRDEIRWLAEARVAVKTSISETRTERFLAMGTRGALSVYLKHYGAHTGRLSGGDKTNFQNMNRGGALRASLLAPPGWVLAVADSGAIEARVLAWLAGHGELLAGFGRNVDVYSEFASKAYGRKVDRKKNPSDKIPGHVGKVCLAGDTKVLTDRGWLAIVDVTTADLLWDGEEWVFHRGLLRQGEKDVLISHSVGATADHEILTERGWQEWSEVLTDPSLFRSALSRASLPSSTGKIRSALTGGLKGGTRSARVRVAGAVWLAAKTLLRAGLLGAGHARGSPLTRPDSRDTARPSRMISTVRGCSTGFRRAFLGATTRAIKCIRIMGAEAFQYALSGAPITLPSCDMSSPSPGGTYPNMKWTGPTLTGTMDRGTSVSLAAERTSETNEKSTLCNNESSPSKKRMQTYDLASAGPRHRFTILSDRGPLIVHNCVLGLGYGMGWAKFARTMLQGAMGEAPIVFTEAEVKSTGIDLERFKGNAVLKAKVEKIPSRLSPDALAVHCAAAKGFVDRWRAENQPIVKLWEDMETILAAMLDDDASGSFGPGDCLKLARHAVILPNGMALRYPGLGHSQDKESRGFSYMGGRGGKEWVKAYGGSVTENIVQALARIIVTDQMLWIMSRLKPIGARMVTMSHDEDVLAVPEVHGETALGVMLEEMAKPPHWAEGLPLKAEGGVDRSYGKAK